MDKRKKLICEWHIGIEVAIVNVVRKQHGLDPFAITSRTVTIEETGL